MTAARRHEAFDRSRQWPDSGQHLLLAAAGMLTTAAVTRMAVSGVVQVRAALAFGALAALGELLRLNLPGDREAAPIGATGALAYALLVRVGAMPARHSAFQVVAVTAIAMIVGGLPRLAAGRSTGLAGMASRLLAVACAAFVFRPLMNGAVLDGRWWRSLAVMALLLCLAWLVEVVITAVVRTETLRARFWVTLHDEMRVQTPLGVSVAASVVLLVFATRVMGLAAVAVFVAPLLVTQVAFRKYAGIRATYSQTVRALARMTEIGGYVEAGHADRVARLAVAIGRRLGMPEPELLELYYAALMHDIGQLSLRDPIPGGATALASPEDQQRIAELGAAVVQQARVLGDVAEIVRRQSEPCGRGATTGPPLSSRIIRVAGVFDDLVGGDADPGRVAFALEQLRLEAGREYDPGVVEALSRIVAHRSTTRL